MTFSSIVLPAAALLVTAFGLTLLFSALRLFRPRLLNALPKFAINECTLPSSDQCTISAWYNQGDGKKPWVVLCHGVGANRADLNGVAEALHNEGFGVMQFDFRAHGKSSGAQIYFGWRERYNLMAALTFLRDEQQLAQRGLVLYGLSMGAASICLLALDQQNFGQFVPHLRAVILDSCYARFSPIIRISAQEWPWFLRLLFMPLTTLVGRWMFRVPDRAMNPVDGIAKFNAKKPAIKILIIHSRHDSFIPFSHAEMLAAAADQAQTWWLEGCDHSETFLTDRVAYQQRLLEFLAKK